MGRAYKVQIKGTKDNLTNENRNYYFFLKKIDITNSK